MRIPRRLDLYRTINMFNFFKRKQQNAVEDTTVRPTAGLFSTHPLGPKVPDPHTLPVFGQPHQAPGTTSDNGFIGHTLSPKRGSCSGLNAAQLGFYAAGSPFIGYQSCAMMATNWLVDKACSMPARDAVRQGYTLGDDEQALRDTDKRFSVFKNLRELIHFGRVYGGRMVLFDVASENPEEYYNNPFNIDGILPGTYQGMSQIDPNWVSPVLTESNLQDPATQGFYEPTFWRVGNRIIHRSHFHFFIPHPVPDFLKPSYNYMGMSVPQRISERVYAAERSANEGPQLLMTKRLIALKVSDSALANREQLQQNLEAWSELMNNYGIKVMGGDEDLSQFDTALGDVDAVIMTQYQLVASAANVPATKLYGTQPKGFNATGEYEAATYREELESIQTNDLTPFLERHYALVSKSLGIKAEDIHIQWAPLDSPTAKEWSEIDKIKADRDAVLFNTGAIDAEDIRDRIREDRESDYFGVEEGSLEETSYEAPRKLGPATWRPEF